MKQREITHLLNAQHRTCRRSRSAGVRGAGGCGGVRCPWHFWLPAPTCCSATGLARRGMHQCTSRAPAPDACCQTHCRLGEFTCTPQVLQVLVSALLVDAIMACRQGGVASGIHGPLVTVTHVLALAGSIAWQPDAARHSSLLRQRMATAAARPAQTSCHRRQQDAFSSQVQQQRQWVQQGQQAHGRLRLPRVTPAAETTATAARTATATAQQATRDGRGPVSVSSWRCWWHTAIALSCSQSS